MNEVLINREVLINSGNDGILKDLLTGKDCFNALWGPDYIIMYEKNFIENNSGDIIEMMLRTRSLLCPWTV